MMGLFNLLEPLDLPSTGGLDNSSNVHFLIEAMKFAFGARSEVTDPAFASNLTRLDEFYSKPWADGIRPKIDVSDRTCLYWVTRCCRRCTDSRN
jgi:gamma-glutamyltranspeptidase/glutathione hydrolase/leukotriene-C4 hydrolase